MNMLGRVAEEKKTYTLSFRITDEMKAMLETLAARHTRTIGHEAEHLLKLALALQKQTDEDEPNKVCEKLAGAAQPLTGMAGVRYRRALRKQKESES